MAHDVFVSYSTKDKIYADGVCAGLEANGVRCWIAPRDILPGKDWGEAIIDAISECRVMVVVFSVSANESPQVKREVQRAFEKSVTVVPVRIDDVTPAKSMAYYLSAVHWLDATPPLEGHVHKLVEIVRQLLPPEGLRAVQLIATPEPHLHAPQTPLEYSTPHPRSSAKLGFMIAGAVALMAIAVVSGLYVIRRGIARKVPAPAALPAAVLATAPTQGAPLAPQPGSAHAQSEQAVREILLDLRKMDTQLGLMDRAFSTEMSDAAQDAMRSLSSGEAEFFSYRNVAGTKNGAYSSSGAHTVDDRIVALEALGADPADVVAFADNLFMVRQAEHRLPAAYSEGRFRGKIADLALKLKYGSTDTQAAARKMNERQIAAGLETFHSACSVAHISALKILGQLHAGLPADITAQLGALKNVQPGEIVSAVQLKALEDNVLSDQKRIAAANAALALEADRLYEQQADQWSGAMRPPFKFSDRSIEELAPLCGPYAPDPHRSSNTAILDILNAGNDGHTDSKIACFFAYATIFSKMDTTAEEYARAGCQFTLQSDRLGCHRALFLSKLLDGPAKEGGLREGDILVDYGSTAVNSQDELAALLKEMPAGEPVRVEFLRRDALGRFERQTVTLPRGGSLGATFLPI